MGDGGGKSMNSDYLHFTVTVQTHALKSSWSHPYTYMFKSFLHYQHFTYQKTGEDEQAQQNHTDCQPPTLLLLLLQVLTRTHQLPVTEACLPHPLAVSHDRKEVSMEEEKKIL